MSEDLKTNESETQPTVIDPHSVPIKYVDWIVTSGIGPAPAIFNIALAAVDHTKLDTNGIPQAVLQVNLRMSAQTAQNIVTVLQSGLDALAPPKPDQMVN